MTSPVIPLLLAIVSVCGLALLIRSIRSILALYTPREKIIVPATESSHEFELKSAGSYEIVVRRPSVFGVIPHKIKFTVKDLTSHAEIPVTHQLNLLGQRKGLSGDRIVPIAFFEISDSGRYQLNLLDSSLFKKGDRIQVMPKTGSKGFVLIFVILAASILFIGGLVMSVLLFLGAYSIS